MDPTLVPVHTKVRGRARFKLSSLVRSPDVCRWFHAEVQRLAGIHGVRCNALTGSVLVFFDPDEDWSSVAERISGSIAMRSGGRLDLPPVPAAETKAMPVWHALETQRVLDLTETSLAHGLDPDTAERRIHLYGANRLQEGSLRRRSETLKDQLMPLPMALLAAEAVAILISGALLEAGLLALTLAANVLAGYLIDRRAEQALARSKRRPRPSALVMRGGRWVDVPGEAIVVGDVLKLTPGTYVGADCRVVYASHLKIDESLLTGESRSVDKHAEAIPGSTTPLFERRNMAFMGTLVVGGEGLAVVVATGSSTAYGEFNTLYYETLPPQTPVTAKINSLSGTLLTVVLAAGGYVFVAGLLRGRRLLTAFGQALAVAASGMPAGLPTAATVNMALGFQRLQRKDVSIRRAYSLESLSALKVIGFDKTGTLTRSRINVQKVHVADKTIHVDRHSFLMGRKPYDPLEDPDVKRLLQACVLCTESRIRVDIDTARQRISGSPTEVALLHMAMMANFDLDRSYRRHALRKIRHRSDEDRYMVSVHAAPGGRTMVFVKGDPMEVVEMCAWRLRNGRRIKLSNDAVSGIESQNQRMAGEALRVLGFAYRTLAHPPEEDPPLRDLTWIGMVGMAEPVRAGVGALIDQLHRAGIRTVMITGDQSSTAEAVARRIGLHGDEELRIFDSSRFDVLPPQLATALIRDVHVFARVNPSQKLQIIQAYQNHDMVVAMTGDGINDGPAMRAADVGIAMGLSGTDAAREVADMVLERDNITAVAPAVMEGRAAFRNLKRALRYFIAINFSDIFLMSAGAALVSGGALHAYRPIHINPLTDLAPGLSLLMEPTNPQVGHESPRERDEPLFSRPDMRSLLVESGVLTLGGLGAFAFGLVRYGAGARAATLAYTSLTAAKALHALTCRPWTAVGPTQRRESNPYLNTALSAVLVAQAAALLMPGLRRILKAAPLSFLDLTVVGLSAWSTRLINRKLRESRL